MKNRLSLVLLVLALVHYGASESQGTDPDSASGSSKKNTSKNVMTSPQGFAFDQLVKFFQKKPEKSENETPAQLQGGGGEKTQLETTTDEKPINAYVMPKVVTTPGGAVSPVAIRTVRTYPKLSSMSGGVSRVRSVPVPPPLPRIPAPVKINQVVLNVVSMNEQIKRLKEKEAAELEKAEGQELVHRTILDEQAEGLQGTESAQKSPEEKALLAQEKLRKVHEKTQRNAQMSNALEDIPAEAGPGPDKKS